MASTSSNRRGFLSGLAAVPAMGLPVLAAPATSDLAKACYWAVAHRAWLDESTASNHWTDERLDEECSRVDAVFTRAIEEPSADLRDLHAKATLALEDFERFTAVPGEEMDDGIRIVVTVLREMVAMGAVA